MQEGSCEAGVHSLHQPFRYLPVYIRMLDMKEVDRDFWTSYLDDILTYSGESWALFGRLTQVVLAQAAARIKIQP